MPSIGTSSSIPILTPTTFIQNSSIHNNNLNDGNVQMNNKLIQNSHFLTNIKHSDRINNIMINTDSSPASINMTQLINPLPGIVLNQ